MGFSTHERISVKGEIPTAFKLGVLVIIPKDDKGGTRGIGLLETIHKLVSQVINLRMAKSINFCEEVHGFCRKRGTHTAIGETKISMQIAACKSDTIFQVFLDLRKAYDSIDRNRVLKLLEKYGVGPNITNYIKEVWDNQLFLLRQASFYSKPIEVRRGCTQGDVDSPIIFNVIIDAVLRAWKKREGFQNSKACFYADDGLLEHNDAILLQQDLDKIIDLFSKIGLQPNAQKTKFMIFRGPPAPRALTREQYKNIHKRRKQSAIGRVKSQQWRSHQVTCPECGKNLSQGYLSRHLQTQHNQKQ